MKKFVVAIFLAFLSATLHSQEIPRPVGYVNDFANIIDDQSKNEIGAIIESTERSTGVEIAVVTVANLGEMPIEEMAIKYFESWGIGKKGKDNGVLILVAPNDRKAWIQTGYGIEGVLPDGLVGEIYRNEMVPRFKQGDFGGGILATVYKISKVVGGEKVSYSPKKRQRNNVGSLIYLVFLILVLSSFFGRRRRGSGLGALWFLTGLGMGSRSGGQWGGSSGGFGGFGGFGGGSTGGGGAGGSW
jgi:uncharacterized protein